MPALIANFPTDFARSVFEKHGIYLLETLEDGQTRWGDQPLSSTPYTGKSLMAHHYSGTSHKPSLDIFTIKAIVSKLGKESEMAVIQREMEEYFNLENQ
jgi:hypothetical protein